MKHTIGGYAVVAWMVAGLVGCGDSGGGDEPMDGESCTTGAVFDCVGPGGCPGRRTCANGSYTTCACVNRPPEPTDASTGGDASLTGDDDAGGAGATDSGLDAALTDAGDTTDAATDAATDAGSDAATGTCDNCVSGAPGGWDGPVWVYEGASSSPSCSGDYPDVALTGGTTVSASAATCSTCDCSGTGTCPSDTVFESGGTDFSCGGGCNNSVTSSCALLTPACVMGQTDTYVQTKRAGGAVAGCTPTAQSPSVPPTTWDANARACAPSSALPQGICDTGEVCAPDGPFAGMVCVYQTGDVSCPGAGYTEKHLYHTGVNDTRDCTSCACGRDCEYTWNFYDVADTTCMTPVASITAVDQCVAVSVTGDQIRVGASSNTAPGACTPSGGTPIGTVTEQDPVTFCCVP